MIEIHSTLPGQNSKVDVALASAGEIFLTLGALLIGFGLFGRSLERPFIAYVSLAVGILAFGVLAARHRSIARVARPIVAFSLAGAVAGGIAYALGWAFAAQSWGAVTVLVLTSIAISLISFRHFGGSARYDRRF